MPSRLIKTLVGEGQILKDGEYICTVEYKIQVRQNYIISSSHDHSHSEIPGVKELDGEIQVSETERMTPVVLNTLMSGSILTLHLEEPIEPGFDVMKFFLLSSDRFYVGKISDCKCSWVKQIASL